MRSQRALIDYSLAKRATLLELFSGRASTMDVCDAHPYLLRAAKYHGEPSEATCPVCRKEPLTLVTYVYGDALKESSGRVHATEELPRLERDYDEVTVYVVEVCRNCGWNHLDRSFVIGRAGLPPKRRRAAER